MLLVQEESSASLQHTIGSEVTMQFVEFGLLEAEQDLAERLPIPDLICSEVNLVVEDEEFLLFLPVGNGLTG